MVTTTVPSKVNNVIIPKCPFFDYCNKVAKNGFCDLRCNIVECNFDSGDCIDKDVGTDADIITDKDIGTDKDVESDKKVDVKCPESCIHHLGNGICNEECNIKICNFDENDCRKSSEESIEVEKAKLKIVYEINPANFDKTKAIKFLDKFSQLSNIPNIHYSKTDSGDFEIYKWTKDTGKGDLIKLQGLSALKTNSNLEGVEVYFNVDFGECKSSKAKCRFQNAKDVESYINTAPVYEVTN
uniref:LNR domain-containing protein n=1 Tax=Panagrolaimus superbus TaxID=310955 RepID=A0A914XV11_9BILA